MQTCRSMTTASHAGPGQGLNLAAPLQVARHPRSGAPTGESQGWGGGGARADQGSSPKASSLVGGGAERAGARSNAGASAPATERWGAHRLQAVGPPRRGLLRAVAACTQQQGPPPTQAGAHGGTGGISSTTVPSGTHSCAGTSHALSAGPHKSFEERRSGGRCGRQHWQPPRAWHCYMAVRPRRCHPLS